MSKCKVPQKAQSTLEYAVLVGVIVAALIAMQVYLRRAYQGRIKDRADDIGEQFSPGHSTSNFTTTTFSNTTENLNTSGVTNTTINQQTSNRTGSETVENLTTEGWNWNRTF